MLDDTNENIDINIKMHLGGLEEALSPDM